MNTESDELTAMIADALALGPERRIANKILDAYQAKYGDIKQRQELELAIAEAIARCMREETTSWIDRNIENDS